MKPFPEVVGSSEGTGINLEFWKLRKNTFLAPFSIFPHYYDLFKKLILSEKSHPLERKLAQVKTNGPN